jgi:tetratricopeptide (TPR) repeat protein
VKLRLCVGAAALCAAALAALFGGVLRHDGQPAAAAGALPTAVAGELQKGFAAGDTQAEIAGLQAELRLNRRNVKALDTLGLAYQQRVRETGDASYYVKADGILHEALRIAPRDLIATAGLGQLALSRHRFREALALGMRARRISPTTAGVYGVIGDAELELGRYRGAFAAFDRMATLKPSVASYARVSYARELIGHVAGAERAMQLAASAAVGEREASSWTHVQLGLLYLGHAQPQRALRELRIALALDSTYYVALDGMAQVQASLGHHRQAIRYARAAVDRVPLPAQVALLGDLYAATGQKRLAAEQYGLIHVIEKLLTANGVRNDLDIALFDADHGIALRHAVVLARRGYASRPSVFGDDVLAWTLARNGECRQALPYSNRSLRLGTIDALKFFHRGWIAACLGKPTEAARWYRRALALNPRFSILWAPVARKGATP